MVSINKSDIFDFSPLFDTSSFELEVFNYDNTISIC